jgi:hypothetical protein
MAEDWRENVSGELTSLMDLAVLYQSAARMDASGWMAGTKRAADTHDSLKAEFARKCADQPRAVAEGLLRLRDALHSSADVAR